MKALVALGNPGPRYETTRHNVGFVMLDLICDHFGGRWEGNKFDGLFGEADILNHRCKLLKPQTFMNVSGSSVAKMLRFYKIPGDDVIVIHDDLDMKTGTIKSRKGGGGHGGHNGIRSLMQQLGHGDFHRIKIGIGRPDKNSKISVSSWVLGSLSEEELKILKNQMFDETLKRLGPLLDLA